MINRDTRPNLRGDTTGDGTGGGRWTTSRAERRRIVADLLEQAGITEPPVPVEQLARALGATVRYVPFDGELSGMLYHEAGQAVIGVNALHSPTRQRFTIAHELGHLRLHGKRKFHVDRNFRTLHRDEHSAAATDPTEMEANDFAACLLMPAEWLEHDITGHEFDYEQDESLRVLADRYRVSLQAMLLRLTKLGLLRTP